MKDFRGITLISIAGKVHSKMLRTFQPGFTKGKNCLKQIY